MFTLRNRIIIVLSIFWILLGCNLSVNRSIHIRDGEKVQSSLNTVNGGIYIGSNCEVRGSSRSVNGNIRVERDSEVEDLQTVNGRIRLAENVSVDGDVESVNGSIDCDRDVRVRGDVESINGDIEIRKTDVRHNITTYNGDITLSEQSRVQGDIIIKRSKGHSDHHKRIRIEIIDSVVDGDIYVEDKDKDVRVYLSRGGEVKGRISGAEVIR